MSIKAVTIVLALLACTQSKVFLEHGLQETGKQLHSLFHDVHNDFYVDIGAYDPMHGSNTLSLYAQGWGGINVEANPSRFQNFMLMRPDQTNINYAVGEPDKFVTLYEMSDDTASTVSSEWVAYLKDKRQLQVKQQIKTPSISLAQLCQRFYYRKPTFLSINLEGNGLKVLESNNWTNPKCVPEVIYLRSTPQNSGVAQPTLPTLQNQYKKLDDKIGAGEVYIRKELHDKYLERRRKFQADSFIKAVEFKSVVDAIGASLNIKTSVAPHYQKNDEAVYYFIKGEEALDLSAINNANNLLGKEVAASVSRPIFIFHFNPFTNVIFSEASDFTLSEVKVGSYKFWKFIGKRSGASVVAYIFNHQFDNFSQPKVAVPRGISEKPRQAGANPVSSTSPTQGASSSGASVTPQMSLYSSSVAEAIEQRLKQFQKMKTVHQREMRSISTKTQNKWNSEMMFYKKIEQFIKQEQNKTMTGNNPESSSQLVQTMSSLDSVRTLQLFTGLTVVVMSAALCAIVYVTRRKVSPI